MSFHSDLISYLQANETVRQNAPGGVFHEFVPQGQTEYPVLVVSLISNVEVAVDLDYPDGAKLEERRYQFDIQGQRSEQVVDAVEAIDAMMVALRGAVGSTSVQWVERTGQRDLSSLDGDKLRRRISTDYTIYF